MGFDRVLSEFCAVLRRDGLALSPVEAIDLRRAATLLDLTDRDAVKHALASVAVKNKAQLQVFSKAFDAFFVAEGASAGRARTLWERLAERGFSTSELDALTQALGVMAEASGGSTGGPFRGDASLDALLVEAGRASRIEGIQSAMQIGFFTQRVLERVGASQTGRSLPALRTALRDALGDARTDLLIAAVEEELERVREAARDYVRGELARRTANVLERFRKEQFDQRAFAALSAQEIEEVEREIRRFAERLGGAARVRKKRARRGSLDLRATLRRAHGTLGIPFAPVFRKRKRDRPKLVLLCDVSDSVRTAARFLLILAYALQELFSRTRTFVFVSDLAETTALFERHPIHRAIQIAYGGGAVNTASNSHYGRAFSEFARAYPAAIDKRTTLVVVGDARNNHQDPRADVFRDLAAASRRVIWLNPEPRGAWGFGDSVMPAYAKHCDAVWPVYDLASLREAVRKTWLG